MKQMTTIYIKQNLYKFRQHIYKCHINRFQSIVALLTTLNDKIKKDLLDNKKPFPRGIVMLWPEPQHALFPIFTISVWRYKTIKLMYVNR